MSTIHRPTHHDIRPPQGRAPLPELPLILPTLPGPDEPRGPSERPQGQPGRRPLIRPGKWRRFPPFTFFGVLSLALASPSVAMEVGPDLVPGGAASAEAVGIVGGGRVHTPQGLASAGSLSPGDWVLAGEPDRGGIGYAQVVDVRRQRSQSARRIFLGDQEGLEDVLVLGADQRLWVFGEGWLKVASLRAGMRIRTADGAWICLLGVEEVQGTRELVHLSLEPDQALVVGLDGIFTREPEAGR